MLLSASRRALWNTNPHTPCAKLQHDPWTSAGKTNGGLLKHQARIPFGAALRRAEGEASAVALICISCQALVTAATSTPPCFEKAETHLLADLG